MGFFDDLLDLPGKIIEKAVETPFVVVEKTIEGVEKGVTKFMDKLDGN